jgi:hypothetical protein
VRPDYRPVNMPKAYVTVPVRAGAGVEATATTG